MPSFEDQCGNHLILNHYPQRIISLVPSQTELLYFLGLENEVKGITKFCIHPAAWQAEKEKVGGTKKLHLDVIRTMKPDLILANKEENEKEQVEQLQKEFPVWISNIKTWEDALNMIDAVGNLTGKNSSATLLNQDIRAAFNKLNAHASKQPWIPAAYLIWKNPYMAAGADTFIHDMMNCCKFQNVFAGFSRYPVVSVSQIKSSGCKLLLLSSEPYPFSEKHAKELGAALPGIRILQVDGAMFSWYGSRLLQSASYFNQLLSSLQC